MDLLPRSAEAILDRERALLIQLHGLLVRVEADGDVSRRLRELAEGLSNLFLVVVVGEFNAGKSTVINALFGEVVMEEGPVPTTDRITVLRYGERSESHRQGDFITERLFPSPFLKGLALVDTPGTNSIIQEHQAITEDYIPRADLVLFVTSFDRPLSESERKFLGFIRGNWGKQLVVVLNKADMANGEANPVASLAQVLEHIRKGFIEHIGFEPRIFPVAARPALAAKQRNPEPPELDDQWVQSGFGEFQNFLIDHLTADERLAMKLKSPLDAADIHILSVDGLVRQRFTVLEADEASLGALHARFKEKEEQLRSAFDKAVSEVDVELVEMENRGVRFLTDTIRVSKLGLIRNRDAFKEEFTRQVIRDAERRIEERTGVAVDTLLRHVYELWNETSTHISRQHQLAEPTKARALERDTFMYNRDEVFRDVMREADRTMDAYNLNEEARRILENTRATAALFAGTQVAALGLGAIATVVVAASAIDVTGGFVAAGVLAAFGFVLLPRQRRRAVHEFSERVRGLRTDLRKALQAQLDEEVTDAVARVHKLVEPLEILVGEQRQMLEKAQNEASALESESAAIRLEVAQQFGEATSLTETPSA